MSLFPSYLNGINQMLQRKAYSPDVLVKAQSGRVLMNEQRSVQLNYQGQVYTLGEDSRTLITFDKQQMEGLFGKNKAAFSEVCIGSHPHIKAMLEHNQMCNYYCVSMFLDIKGSTKLATKYSLPEVRRIKDTVLTLCIHAANFFGGHVHRMQGDAVFLQFVGKDLHPNDAIINALNAASVLCQFISNDLSHAFEAMGIDPIKVRVGIDYGPTDKVLWSHYGIPGCSELTTTSLHTDLAAKLQAQAANNEIRIGHNMKDALDLPEEFWKYAKVKDDKGDWVQDDYVFNYANTRYRKYIFDWDKYLRSYDFVESAGSAGKLKVDEKQLRIICMATRPDGTQFQYFQNSEALPKDTKLQYTLIENGRQYIKKPFDKKILWTRVNRGAEAAAKDISTGDEPDQQQNTPRYDTSATYLGHHYSKCRIEHDHSPSDHLKFPIFVQ